MMKDEIKIGMLGLGTVGSGAAEILRKNRRSIREKTGTDIVMKTVLVRDVTRSRKADLTGITLTTEPADVLTDPEIDLVVEVMGGIDTAYRLIKEALERGKDVVTANKDLLARHGLELHQVARAHNRSIFYEGSVGGGIPLIRPLKHCLAANRITRVMGIINGTTNYILTQMTLHNKEFSTALTEAQEKGFAEQDPSSDLQGRDAANKLAILAADAFRCRVTEADVYREGIEDVKLRDILYASELGYVVKLLALGEDKEEGVTLRVHPALIPATHPLAGVYDEFNAVFIEGDAVGEVMFYGRGAGSLPTGSAVVADIIDVVRNINHQVENGLTDVDFQRRHVIPMARQHSRFYLRLWAKDEPGVFAGLATSFGDEKVSLDRIIQKHREEDAAEIVLVTHDVEEEQFHRALDRIKALPAIRSIEAVLRVV